ncbi:Gfo/Idh/MocA family protein [Acetanaerobacterium elongatum]|uniref:Predicted dehydrogenase n=1 Tax=Acetanaerobacterium elongatum TaxID=258515 RepID=A0A1H0C835_9FIRM|nr:Gfo/Idh/MocA family oxidoreductase [Acetanaerobacterium elongatum]SDN54027.1 Predicted dehydrogenase [Acetanaerobacterium elongatum]
MNVSDGMNYAPIGKYNPVVKPGEFVFAAVGLDHGHIYGMSEGLLEAGATLKWVYDPDPAKMEAFCKRFSQVKPARSEDEVLGDKEVLLVAGACVASERCALGLRVMNAGKDYFTDKAPLTTLEQLKAAKETCAKTGKKYAVYYAERIHSETAVFAGQLIAEGAIGRVIQVLGLGPHRLGAPGRPDWFFIKEKYGGILCDIGSHQIEQILYYTGAKDATVVRSQIANYHHPQYPGLDDFGDATLVTDNGATGYFRVDWFTPDGLQTWGDGRSFILGTEGFIEQRKYMNIGTPNSPAHLYLANGKGETHFDVHGKVGFPYFGSLILDCLNRTENAMTQEHAFKAAELCVKAQLQAVDIGGLR